MSLPGKFNRNTAKRVYNINSLNYPVILDLYNQQQLKNLPYGNINSQQNQKNQQISNNDDKISPLTITAKSLVSQNTLVRNNNRQYSKAHTQLQKNIKQMRLILEQPSQNIQISKDLHEKFGSLKTTKYSNTKKHNSQKNLSQTDVQSQKYYEQAIVNDPALYNQVITAYKQFQKAVNINDKKQILSQKRLSSNKIMDNIQQNFKDKIIQPKQKVKNYTKYTNEYDSKNDQQRKKVIQFNLYRQFQFVLNLSNQIIIVPQQQGQYKAFIGKGNNGLLIKSILKTRPWWSIRTVQDIDSCNIIWSEWKRPKYMKVLADGRKFQKSNEEGQNSQKNIQNNKNIKKYTQLQKIISKDKIKKYEGRIDPISEDEIMKIGKKVSDPIFASLASKKFPQTQQQVASKTKKIVNHIPGCFQLHSKKLLYANMRRYYQKKGLNVCDYLPQTYVISKGLNDAQYQNFIQAWTRHQKSKSQKGTKNIWICKPGQNSNRGNGITVASTLNQIKSFISSHSSSNGMCSALIQKYMENPFLYNKRKFDMRCYILITTVNGIVKGYWYEEGYIRTTSKQFTLKNIQNKFIHLTNDAIQKKGDNYGKFQSCNKVSYQEFQKYLEQNHKQSNFNFKITLQKMKRLATDLIQSVGKKLNPEFKQYSFELFGLDFMLDDKLQPFIIQANSNPCIQVSGNVLGRIIPSMLQNVIRITIDPIFPAPYSQNSKTTKYSPGNAFEQNKFGLVYDSLEYLNSQQQNDNNMLTKQQEEEERLFNDQMEQENEEN